MAGNNAGKAGMALGGIALVTAAIALAQKNVRAAEGNIVLDAATMELLMAMAQSSADIEALLAVIAGIQPSEPGAPSPLTIVGYPPNTDDAISTRVQIVALDRPYRLPDIAVPDGMVLQLKGWPTNAGTIYVARSAAAAVNINQVWPLLPNEAIGYQVKNANTLYVAGIAPLIGFGVAGDWVAITVEQKK